MQNKRISLVGGAAIVIVLAVTVSVLGYVFIKNTQVPVPQSQISEPVMELAAPVDETDGWKIYTDSKNGFEFKYPSVCKVEEALLGIEGVYLSSDIESELDTCNFGIAYYEDLSAISSGAPLPRNSVADFVNDPNLKNTQKTTFQGSEALRGVFENKNIGLKMKQIYIARNGHLYDVSYDLQSSNHVFKAEVPEKIISSLKFTK